jgi:hypothetical protein
MRGPIDNRPQDDILPHKNYIAPVFFSLRAEAADISCL